MELGLVTKPDKRNMATPKKIDDNVMSADCDVIDLWPIGAIQKPDSENMIKSYGNSNILSFKS